MNKVYKLLNWLNMPQAKDWLEDLTQTEISDWNLLQLCDSGQCAAYLECWGMDGSSIDYSTTIISAIGMHKVLNPLELIHCGKPVEKMLEFFGLASTQEMPLDHLTPEPSIIQKEIEWRGRKSMHSCFPIFKREEIQALAERMNGIDERPSRAYFEELSHQLELEREARKAAEAKLKTHASEDTITPSKDLTFPYTTKHLEAMREAALEFWQKHEKTVPAPHGIQKKVQNFLADRIGASTRKVAELATAIKPDDLPKS